MNTTSPTRLDALLRRAGARIAAADAKTLLAHALGRPLSWLYAHGDEIIDNATILGFDALVDARAAGQPLAYLIGRCGFWTLELAVTPATLIPRVETERLVELALSRLPTATPLRVADLGAGSGAIALAIARERPLAQVVATDVSGEALQVARANAVANAIGNVEFRQGSWFAPLADARVDMIVSNPPYIPEGDPHLGEGDLRYEPAMALSSGDDGLQAIREIVAHAPSHLEAGGWLLVEHGWEQGAAIRALFSQTGFVEVSSERDLEGRERVTLGCWRG